VDHVERGQDRAHGLLVGVGLVETARQDEAATPVLVHLLDEELQRARLAEPTSVARQPGSQGPQVSELQAGVEGAEDELVYHLLDLVRLDVGIEQETVLAVVIPAEASDRLRRERVLLETPMRLHPHDLVDGSGGGHAGLLSRWGTRVSV
jgi:hypothetical protein